MHLKMRTGWLVGLLALAVSSLSGRAQTCTVNWTNVHQRIDGFGGGVVFLNPGSLDPVSDANMNTLFGSANANQLGLSILRVRISPDGNWSAALSDGKKAVALGARILATPWSPPASMKSNNNTIGGSLLAAQFANYANYLNGFAAYMATNRAALAAISVQNEPDITVTYESCSWTATQLQDFFRTNAAAITNAPVMMPESFQFNLAMSDPTLDDAIAVTNVDIVGGHLYGNGDAGITIVDYPKAHNKGKPTWMTEFLVNDQTWGTAITTAQQIHRCLTDGNMSAYIWWKCLGDINGLVNAAGTPQKRGFVMAQFSRFVRTNFYRIGASNTGTALISAYNDTNSGNFAIVAVNTNNTSINQTFNLTNFSATSVTPWMTTSNLSLASQTPVTVSGSSFTYTLPALSVVTFVGQSVASAPNTAPTLALVPNQVINAINAGFQLQVTNVATDPDLPSQTLTFSFLSGPTNATLTKLDATNAVFRWRPSVSQANTTNPISVVVADNGTPSLSATNNFTVTVNPVTNPVIGSVTVSGGQVTLTVSGPQLLDYTVMISTNLTGWQVLFTSNSPVTPVTLVDTNDPGACPVRFYRIQLGP